MGRAGSIRARAVPSSPGLERSSGGVDRTGFVESLSALENHVADYGKPLMLAYGDSHYMRVDKPAGPGLSCPVCVYY
jgi:hypothetical protein